MYLAKDAHVPIVGNFGSVYKCLFDGSTVAAKSPKSGNRFV